ncbi:hypothetical protein ACI2T7_03250 [Ralstonia nicotianae]
MSDLTLKLGSFQFQNQEIPESLPFGGIQQLAKHDLVGGTRVVDSMGAFTAPIGWSGWLLGQDAMKRARALDDLRIAGSSLLLQWSELSYSVVISEFRADFQRFYQIPYRITCEVVSDLSKFAGNDGDQSIDGQISSDAATATGLTTSIGDSTLSGLMGSVNSAISTVSSFANAAQSTINSVLQPVAALRTQVQTMISSANNTLMNVTTLGGILPNNPISTQVSKLGSQITAATNLPILVQLDRVAGRMQTNVGSIYSSAKQVTVAGGNLMTMAAKEYGDALAWTGIAKANPQLGADPQINGVQTVTIPPSPDNVGGVLNS